MINRIKISIIVSIIGIMIIPNILAETINRFQAIPEKPNDFDAYMREIWKGTFVDLCEVPKEYYLQPEFYGNSWAISKEKFYDNPDYSKWGVYGQGNIPREMGFIFENFKEGDEYEICTFFHNGFGIWTYQGFELKTTITKTEGTGGEPISFFKRVKFFIFKILNIEKKEGYFDIEITPNVLTMTPTFPVFEDGWVRPINLKLKANENIEKGTYVINLRAVAPPQDYSRNEVKRILQFEVDKEKYKQECYEFYGNEEKCNYLVNMREKKYVDGGGYQTTEPLLRLIIEVK